ncbi:MAG: histidine phosphatase family protein [Hyphomicrobiaceae bacterium]
MPDGLTLYCIRHGETDWNKERRYQGQRDIPLNETGHKQAIKNGGKLAGLGLDLTSLDFVASPLGRARETMEHIRAELGLPPKDYTTDARLKEVHYGVWEGQLLSELASRDPDSLLERRADPFNWRPQEGESYADLLTRAVSWLDTVSRDTVVVTHGGISRVLRCHALNLDPKTLLDLEVPQDRVLILEKDQMRWI